MAEKINVVIVEDQHEQAEQLKRWLALRDDEVTIFDPTPYAEGSTAEEAQPVVIALLSHLEGVNAKAVVLDLALHDTAGFNGQVLCRTLREKCPKLGLVCVTAMPLVQGVNQYADWGADCGWTKPWSRGKVEIKPADEAKRIRSLIVESARARDCCDFSEGR